MMPKITVKAQHLDSVTADEELARAYAANREVSDACAVTVASWWQSSGWAGSELAALASGAPVEYEELARDIHRVRTTSGTVGLDARHLDQLSTWALDRTGAGTRDYPAHGPRFTVTARWANGNGQRDEVSYSEVLSELDALKRSLDGLAPGDEISVRRLS